ncbi:MAG: aldo/keto reductase [Chitinophagales bacterium]|nr:aldo/keto reductase [Chitinophagales bacterium]MDW8418717.1 aldo/keto reductase [Chitinophagales bacterium]
MEYRRLGKSGLQVSALSLGSWVTFGNQISDDVAKQLMVAAYEAGVNFFDNAEVYAYGRSEIVMGNILRKMNWDRDTWLVSSKVYWGRCQNPRPNQKGLMRKHIVEACNAALQRLQVDYLDIYFAHRPDVNTPMEEVVWSFHNLILQGKILYWGTSEWTAQQITEAHLIAEKHHLIGPVAEQNQYNMLHRKMMERDYLPLFQRFGMGTTIWSPLASGLLTDKYFDGTLNEKTRMDMMQWLRDRSLGDAEKMDKARKLHQLAKSLGIPLAQLALAWCLKNPNVSTVILGASKLSQLQENLKCFDALPLLTDDVMEQIESILQNKPSLPVY